MKKALVITYHIKKCKRIGGFHYFIKFLTEAGYDVDWMAEPVSISWIVKRRDKENIRNFLELWRSFEFEQDGQKVRHFSVPMFIPAQIAKKLGLKIGTHYYPSWKRVRKRLADSYDVIVVEGVADMYAYQLKNTYPNSKIIYRPSDVLKTALAYPNADDLERDMILTADITFCVDEAQREYYWNHVVGRNIALDILRNPLATDADIEFAAHYTPIEQEKKKVVYVGVSMADQEVIEYAAKRNSEAEFIIVGPFNFKSHDNIRYTGSLSKAKYEKILKNAWVGMSPLSASLIKRSPDIYIGYTRKIVNYMKFLMPIVATCSTNYLNVPGFHCADNKEEFSDMVSDALKQTVEDRIALREDYVRVMRVFSEDGVRERFLKEI